MRSLLTALVLAPALAAAQSPNLDDYLIFGTQRVKLKNLQLTTPGCHVGTNCARPHNNAPCGVLIHTKPVYVDGTQLVGDTMKFRKAGGSVWEAVTNDLTAPAEDVEIRNPPTISFTPPVIPDLDEDGTPSCDGGCAIDVGDFETGCGFPDPFPECGSHTVIAMPGQDCVPDAVPGNDRCDPPPGAYLAIDVRNEAAWELQGGDYVVCTLAIGKNTQTTGTGRLLVHGRAQIGNGSTFGADCHDIDVLVAGPSGSVTFGTGATVRGRVCAPQRSMRVGSATILQGRFLGRLVTGGVDTMASCCDP